MTLAAMRFPWRRAADETTAGTRQPGTMLRAAVAAGIVVVLLLGVAALFRDGFTTRSEMERYLRNGPRAGAAALERDLREAHPVGSGIGLLFDRLHRLGFDCGAALDAARSGACVLRARLDDRQVVTVEVAIRHDGARLQGLAVQMGNWQPGTPR